VQLAQRRGSRVTRSSAPPLGEVDFGDEKQMSVFRRTRGFPRLHDALLRLDYVDARGDVMLVNVLVGPVT